MLKTDYRERGHWIPAMKHCWAIREKGLVHRASHGAVHRLRHHYHSLAVKLVAPAIVCVSTGAGLALWPASAPPSATGHPGFPGAAVSPSPALVPVGGGIFVAFLPTPPMDLTIPLQLSEFPAELSNSSITEIMPTVIESLITASPQIPSQPPEAVPEPSSILLLGAAISLFALIRYRER